MKVHIIPKVVTPERVIISLAEGDILEILKKYLIENKLLSNEETFTWRYNEKNYSYPFDKDSDTISIVIEKRN